MSADMGIRELTKNLSVGGQINPETLKSLAERGFTDIVCNRPDSEHPDGPVSEEVAAAASALGLKFHYLPIEPNEEPEPQSEALARLLAKPDRRIFAYCRTGGRSTTAWKKSTVRTP